VSKTGKKLSKSYLSKYFGKTGMYYYEIVRGIDNREVIPNQIRKSIGTEQTFDEDIKGKDKLKKILN